ncbi:hypothetical protein PILCRDRAFT_328891 [Piloderma croceum F 1598]|uniref:Uncharacterized protein n=1 Tax=Piloderma croceum (strain F 1598) TaxID=765440 RepID=A0A0C3FPC6_PILCF|nr:hypothetical protein PILCRDRAFT_328891 [Piloderma croceum F 1598]
MGLARSVNFPTSSTCNRTFAVLLLQSHDIFVLLRTITICKETCSLSRNSDARSITITSERVYAYCNTHCHLCSCPRQKYSIKSKIFRPNAYIKINAGESHCRRRT